MTTGLFLGKFMPPHAGHLFVCDVAMRRVDTLMVLVCSHDAEPIDGALRAKWMRASLCTEGVRVIHMPRDIPQEPSDHPDFWPIWRAAVAEHHPAPIDWVFGSETYVHRLASEIGARPFVVDISRTTVPVSASAIRADPAAHWAFVPAAVRPHYQKRITLIGPESTGKSTMAAYLAQALGTLRIPEYGRDFDATFRKGAGWSSEDFVALAQGHVAQASAIAARAGPVVIEDTDVLQTVVWAEALLGEVPPAVLALLDDDRLRQRKYILLCPTVRWIDDGTRYFAADDQRHWFTDRLRHWLRMTDADWTVIDQTEWSARQTAAELAAMA